MSNNFIKMTREEREARKLAEGIASGTIIPVGSGPLPASRDIDLSEQLRAARLDGLARDFANAAQSQDRAELMRSRRYRDLRFHPRYKREFMEANQV